jgi:hypothetical protein
MELKATETVIEQAKLLASEFSTSIKEYRIKPDDFLMAADV